MELGADTRRRSSGREEDDEELLRRRQLQEEQLMKVGPSTTWLSLHFSSVSPRYGMTTMGKATKMSEGWSQPSRARRPVGEPPEASGDDKAEGLVGSGRDALELAVRAVWDVWASSRRVKLWGGDVSVVHVLKGC